MYDGVFRGSLSVERLPRKDCFMKKRKDDEKEGLETAPVEGASEGALEGEPRIQAPPGEDLERLQAELEAKTRLAEDNYAKFLRAAADLENYKKRVEKEKARIIDFANEDLIIEILPVIDNLERALAHSEGEQNNLESLVKGVKLTIDQIYAVFKKSGLKEIMAVGEKFDPGLHHAISHEDDDEAEPGTVVKEFQKGYLLKGKLIRPSMVMVAKEPVEGPAEDTDRKGDGRQDEPEGAG